MDKLKLIRILAICLSAVMVLSAFAACGKSSGKSKGDLLATVDGHEIYENETKDFVKTALVLEYQYAWSSAEKADKDSLVKETYLGVLIDDYLIRKYLDSKDVKKKDVITKEVKTQMTTALDSVKNDQTVGPLVTSEKITDDMLNTYFEYYFYTQAFIDKVNKDTPVKDDEIKKYYDDPKNADSLIKQESIKVSHILIKDEAHTADKKKIAEEVLKKAKAGDNFEELVNEYSDDEGSKAGGGDVGEVTADAQLVPEFIEGSLKLNKTGDISDIVESQYGFHIIKATSDKTPAGKKTLEEAKNEIVQAIQNTNITKLIEKLRKKAKIVYDKGTDPNAPKDEATKAETPAAETPTADGVKDGASDGATDGTTTDGTTTDTAGKTE